MPEPALTLDNLRTLLSTAKEGYLSDFELETITQIIVMATLRHERENHISRKPEPVALTTLQSAGREIGKFHVSHS
jgi:hypothetical protein